MNEVQIRPAASGDVSRIAEIYGQAVREGTASYELDPPSLAEMQARFSTLSDGGFPYLVAVMPHDIVGYAYAGPFRPRQAYRFMVEDSIYVAPEAKGRGIGRMLLERLLVEARALGFRQMVAVIGDGSPESPSVRLHERLGFRHSGVLIGSGYKHGRWLDTVFMQIEMNGGSTTHPDADSLPERRFRQRLNRIRRRPA